MPPIPQSDRGHPAGNFSSRVFSALRNGRGLANPEKLGAFVYAVCNNVLSEHIARPPATPHCRNKGWIPRNRAPTLKTECVNKERKRSVREILDRSRQGPPDSSSDFSRNAKKTKSAVFVTSTANYLRVLLHRAKIVSAQAFQKAHAGLCRSPETQLWHNGPTFCNDRIHENQHSL